MKNSRPRDASKVKRIIAVLADGGSYAEAGRATGMTRSGARLLHIRWAGKAAHRVRPGKATRGVTPPQA